MLPYENQMFLDVLHADGLVVAAKGLGLDHVFYSLLRVYSDPGNLVLVMGTTEAEEEHFTQRLLEDGRHGPKKITAEFSSAERQKVYLNGGILFVTTRILCVDMLTDRLPIHLVTGILVYKAHYAAASCQETFILRLYRQKNKTGFIKAFSSSPASFKSNLCPVERAMRNLFLRNLYLWPRFHADVKTSLSECTADVIELHVTMSPSMTAIQAAVLDLVTYTLQELKRLNPSLESYDELTVEACIARSFHKLLQRELDPIWHQLSWKTKQLVADLKTLRTVLVFLTQYDCVTFYAYISALRTTENALKSGGWMLLAPAEILFTTAKSRVLGNADGISNGASIEENPKWSALLEVIKEIEQELNAPGDSKAFPSQKILVLTLDERTAAQIQDVIAVGAKTVLGRMFNKSLGDRYGSLPDVSEAEAQSSKQREPKHKGYGKRSRLLPDPLREDSTVEAVASPLTLVQSMHIGTFELYRLVSTVRPQYVIMYDIDMAAVRLLEVFQAKHVDLSIRVYFMMYEKSVEEQAYLSTVRSEKEAFEHLIREKSTMMIPEDREGRGDHNQDLQRDPSKASDAILEKTNNAATRKAGGSSTPSSPKVIVDMREFRSELPSLIHKRGIDIEPVTLEVGDYILTPEICVERKSISDLIGSLQNGRLFNQATSMTRFYAKPMLLIEFDQDKPFALQGKYYLSRDIASSDITARLQLLTIHFPKLRILWSPSPHATAELFEELKKGRDEPSAEVAAAVSMDVAEELAAADRYYPSIQDLLVKLPGVTSKNMYSVLNQAESLDDLVRLSRADLASMLGSKTHADELYAGLHERSVPVVPEAERKRLTAVARKGRGARFKTKSVTS